MRCYYCDDGVLQITALTPPDEGWAVDCNKCDYSTRKPTADQIVEQPMTAQTSIKWKVKWIPKRVSSYQGLSEHSLDCLWHRDWHACNCGFFDGEEE